MEVESYKVGVKVKVRNLGVRSYSEMVNRNTKVIKDRVRG
jgi:hypothetical protein